MKTFFLRDDFEGSSFFNAVGTKVQLFNLELTFDIILKTFELQEPNHLFILVNDVRSSTVLSNNLQNQKGKTLHLQKWWPLRDTSQRAALR